MWNFSSLTRGRTPALEGELLTTGPPGKSLGVFFFVGHLDIRCYSCPSPDLAVKVCEVGWELLPTCAGMQEVGSYPDFPGHLHFL